MKFTLPSVCRYAALAMLAAVMALLGPLITFVPRQLPSWSILLALVSVIASLLYRRRLPLPGEVRAFGWLALFLGFALLSLLWSPAHPLWFIPSNLAYLTVVAAINWTTLKNLTPGDQRLILAVLILTLAFGKLCFAVDTASDFPLLRHFVPEMARAQLYYSNIPKRSAVLFALMLWPVALVLWMKTRRLWLLALLLAAAIAVAGFSTSRSALLALVIGTGLLALGAWRLALTRKIIEGVFIAMLLFMPLGAMLISKIPPALTSQLFMNAQQRLMIWDFVGDKIRERPLLGYGLDASGVIADQSPNLPGFVHHPVMSEHPHNAYLQIWLELGAVGMLLALMLARQFFGAAKNLPAAAQPFAWAGIGTALILHMTTYGLWQAWWITGQIMAALVFLLAVRCLCGQNPPP